MKIFFCLATATKIFIVNFMKIALFPNIATLQLYLPYLESFTLSYSFEYPRTSSKKRAHVGKLINGTDFRAYVISLYT